MFIYVADAESQRAGEAFPQQHSASGWRGWASQLGPNVPTAGVSRMTFAMKMQAVWRERFTRENCDDADQFKATRPDGGRLLWDQKIVQPQSPGYPIAVAENSTHSLGWAKMNSPSIKAKAVTRQR